MSLRSKHPSYVAREPDWTQMQHTHAGERTVKAQTTLYLPTTSGMEHDGLGEGQDGAKAYASYIRRAVFPGEVKHAVEGLVGIMHKREPKITVPERMRPMLQRLTLQGENAATLMRRVNEEQLKYGRIGLLLEVPSDQGPTALPYIATYDALSITNWGTARVASGHEEFDLVVLNETGPEQQDDLSWLEVTKYRVLAMSSKIGRIGGTPPSSASYGTALVRGDSLDGATWVRQSIAGRTLSRIPFVVANVQDIAPEPDAPPLLGLSDLCLTIYRGEADYRQALFMQGQETLVIIGDEEMDPDSDADESRIGAGAVLRLSRDSKAEYVGVSADGLDAMRSALDADYKKAGEMGMRLIDTSEGGGQQSGDALRQRIAAKTASLVTIARAGAVAVETVLKMAAELLGENPDEVKVEPNVDFANEPLLGREILDWMQAKQMGAPISNETIHRMMVAREATSFSYEEEQEKCETDDVKLGFGTVESGREVSDEDQEPDPPPASE